MSYTPTQAAQRIAALAGTNQATLANPLTAMQTSIAAGNLAPAALIDAIVATRGFLFQDSSAATSTTSQSSTVAANVFSPCTFNSPITAQFFVTVDLDISCSAFTSATSVLFNLVNTTVNITFNNLNSRIVFTAADRRIVSFRFPVLMAAGNNNLQLTWQLETASMTALVTSGVNCRTFTVSG